MEQDKNLEILPTAAFDLEQSLKTLSSQIEQMQGRLKKEKIKIDVELDPSATKKVKSELNDVTDVKPDGLDKVSESLDKISKKSAATVANVTLLHQALRGLERAAQQMVTTAADLDKQLTDLRMVTGLNYDDASRLVDSYNALAKELKSQTSQVLSASDEWLRQGKSVAETEELIRQSMILSKVGAMDSSTATQRLTSTMKGYGLAVEDVAGVVDKFTSVDMAAAVSANDIAEALSHTASSASLAGVSLDKIIAYLTVVGETTQKSASVVGESFKSLFARIEKVTNGAAVDDYGQDISQVEAPLRSLGVELRKSETEFRSMSDVLDEIGGKFNSLDSVVQRRIVTAMGGVYQSENLLALLKNYDKVADYVDIAANSAGTAAEKFQAYQESVEAHYNAMIASAEALAKQTVPTEFLNGLLDAGSAILDFLTNTNLLTIALATLGSAFAVKGLTAFVNTVKDAYNHVARLSQAFNLLNESANVTMSADEFSKLLTVTNGLSTAQMKLIVSSKALTTEQRLTLLTASGLTKEEAAQTLATMGLTTAEGAATVATFSLSGAFNALTAAIAANPIGFIVTVLTATIGIVSTVNQKLEETRNAAKDAADAFDETAKYVDDCKAKIADLRAELDKGNLSEQEAYDKRQQLLSIQDEIVEKLGSEAGAFDVLGASIDDVNKKLGAYTRSQAVRTWNDNASQYEEAIDQMEKQRSYTIPFYIYDNDAGDRVKQIYREIFGDALSFGGYDAATYSRQFYALESDAQTAVERLEQLGEALYDLEKGFKAEGLDLNSILGVDSWADELKYAKKQAQDTLDTFAENYENAIALKVQIDYSDYADKFSELRQAYDDAILKGDDKAIQVAYADMLAFPETLPEDAQQGIRAYFDTLIENFKAIAKDTQVELEIKTTFGDSENSLGKFVKETLQRFSGDNGKIDIYKVLNAGIAYDNSPNKNSRRNSDRLSADEKAYAAIKFAADQAGVSVEEYMRILDKLGIIELDVAEDTERVTQTVLSFVDALADLGTIKTALGSLASAFKDVSSDGMVSFGTLTTIADKFSDVEGISTYIQRLASVRESSEDATEILNELAIAYLTSGKASDVLANSSKEMISAMLDEAGIADSDKVAIDLLAAAKQKVGLQAAIAKGDVGDFIQTLIDEGNSSDTTKNALVNLAAQMVATNSTNMDFASQIAALQSLGSTAIAVGANISSVFAALNGINDVGSYGATVDALVAMAQSAGVDQGKIDALVSGVALPEDMQRWINEARTQAQKVSSGTITYKPTSTKSGSGITTSKAVEPYFVDINAYREAEERLRKTQEAISRTEYRLDNSDDLREQILLQRQLIAGYNDEQDALHVLNDQRDATIHNSVEALRELGCIVQYNDDANELWIENLDRVNQLEGENQEATNALRKETEELINSIMSLNEANRSNSDSWWKLESSIKAADEQIDKLLKDIVKEASEALDSLQSVYDTLHKAADEFAANGNITLDTFQEICLAGAEYVSYLMDENGQLVINEERIRAAVAAKTQQLGVETALTYIESLRIAKQKGNVAELERLLTATEAATDATWGLVYAQLKFLGLSDDQYNAALADINAIRALADSAAAGIGTASGSVTAELQKMKSGLDDLLSYVMEMLRSRTEAEISLIKEAEEAYASIIADKKESIRLSQQEANHQKTIAEKTKEMAKLQAKYDLAGLEGTREAKAQQARIAEQMADLQAEIDEEMNSYSITQQENMLDEMETNYRAERDAEIKVLEDSISSTEKLYRKAMDYLEADIAGDYERLKNELCAWNYDVGNSLESAIVEAWENATRAFERYQSVTAAYQNIDADIAASQSSGTNLTVGKTNYDTSYSNEEAVRAAVNQMKANSLAWHSASGSSKTDLAAENKRIATQDLARYGISATIGEDGVWYLANGRKLYDVYHGGTASAGGHPTLKQNELFALLEDDEMVLNRTQQDVAAELAEYVRQTPSLISDFIERMKLSVTPTTFGTVGSIDKLNPALAGIEPGNVSVNIGDTNIYGGNEDTVRQHQEVTRKFTNEILKQIGIRR